PRTAGVACPRSRAARARGRRAPLPAASAGVAAAAPTATAAAPVATATGPAAPVAAPAGPLGAGVRAGVLTGALSGLVAAVVAVAIPAAALAAAEPAGQHRAEQQRLPEGERIPPAGVTTAAAVVVRRARGVFRVALDGPVADLHLLWLAQLLPVRGGDRRQVRAGVDAERLAGRPRRLQALQRGAPGHVELRVGVGLGQLRAGCRVALGR